MQSGEKDASSEGRRGIGRRAGGGRIATWEKEIIIVTPRTALMNPLIIDQWLCFSPNTHQNLSKSEERPATSHYDVCSKGGKKKSMHLVHICVKTHLLPQ